MNEGNIINSSNPCLIEPNKEMVAEFLAMAEEYKAAGSDRYKSALENFHGYLEQVSNYARGIKLNTDQVSQSEFWLVNDSKIVARSTLRHRLNTSLEHEGGHIGYDVRPSERRKGYGTLVLKLTLEKAVDLGLDKVHLTCDTENSASAKIIEKNGGKFAGEAISKKSGKQISRYWIEI